MLVDRANPKRSLVLFSEPGSNAFCGDDAGLPEMRGAAIHWEEEGGTLWQDTDYGK